MSKQLKLAINKMEKLKNIRTVYYSLIITALVMCISCEKDSENKIDNHITFELSGEKITYIDGYFKGGNSYIDDTRCPKPNCVYEKSFIQRVNSNGSESIHISLNDSITGTYAFNSDLYKLNAFTLVINGNDYRAYSYTENSDDFVVEITKFGSIGERIKGTFSGTTVLVIDGIFTEGALITNGEFDIKREEF